MKKRTLSAFTLIEMLTVMAIIAVIASLVVSVNSLVNNKAAKARAEGEIQAISAASESYKADNGIYPTHSDTSEPFRGASAITDSINPRKDKNPMDTKYQLSSLYLYSQLSGDLTGSSGGPDGKIDADSKVYFPFKPDMLGTEKNKTTGKVEKVLYLQDPFGQSYGYSTAAASAEAEFQRELRKNPSAKRGNDPEGYNAAGFDLWSTGGTASKSGSGSAGAELEQARWIKNW